MAPGLVVAFSRHSRHRYDALLTRPDGVVVRLVGGGFNRIDSAGRRVPHDLAHLVIESGLAIDDGLWGVLARGGLFPAPNTTVVAGRQRPHARSLAAREVAAHREGLRRAEIVVRAVADMMVAGRAGDAGAFRAALGTRWALPGIDGAALSRVAADVRTAAGRWEATAVGDHLTTEWPSPSPRRRTPARR